MSANHDQERIHQVHRVSLEVLAAVLLSVAGRHHSDARIYNLGKLGLGLDRLCPRKPVEAFHHQHGPRWYPALFNSDQKDAECTVLDVPLVVGR